MASLVFGYYNMVLVWGKGLRDFFPPVIMLRAVTASGIGKIASDGMYAVFFTALLEKQEKCRQVAKWYCETVLMRRFKNLIATVKQ
ncbi:MAG: hypothetical protein D9V47_01015 [Clostridia bacterium]|nr:MAG: hypothetical protein D9V47_01015 [Clostridia bacterium]